MNSTIITCPSGLSGRIRGMKAKEERILADRKLANDGAQLDQILAACWEEVSDPGPYSFSGSIVDWSKVLQGDRFFTLLQIRIQSYGPEYAFTVPCQNRSCRTRIDWELNLGDLPVRPLSEESRAAFLAGNRFSTVLPSSGQRITFRLLTGADERLMTRLRKQASDRPITTLLNFRIDAIEGVDPTSKFSFLEELGMADVTYLLSDMDRVDCGVDTTIEVECPECGGIQRIDLPFDQSFFLPERRRAGGQTNYSQA
jgi:hypothetical protein